MNVKHFTFLSNFENPINLTNVYLSFPFRADSGKRAVGLPFYK